MAEGGSKWWLWLLLLLVLPALCLGGCCISFGGLMFGAARNNTAYLEAQPLIEANREVAEKLGTPIKFNTPHRFESKSDLNSSISEAEFVVTGPLGTGTAKSSGRTVGDNWELDELTVTIESSNETIVIK